jgi:Asp-tRNA(Asn)/Glu-tRNA(Gln) amidotransferase A subunit family amidase
MTNDDLCYLTAAEALALFRRRKLSPVELLTALIARSEKLNPRINCWTDTYFDEAMAEAKAAEARYMKRGARLRPLEGVPLAVKDAQRLKGKRTTQGSLIFKDHIDDHSDPMIERLQKAGAIIHGRTTTPEFCLSGACHSRIWGVTRNPWNLDYGPGGSSGGSGAALAAGLTPLATGTDIGGSIRIPASACGVVGFKPPHGRNPDGPPANFDRYNHCGPMTRSVADAALMQSVTAGPHPLDHDSLRSRVRLPVKASPIKGMKIAWSVDLDYVEIDEEVRRNTLAAIDRFRTLGAVTREVRLGWSREIESAAMHWYNSMHFGRQTVWWKKTQAHLMTDYALKLAQAIEKTTGIDDVHKAWEMAHRIYQTLGPVLASHDVFICPTLAVPAVKAEHDPWADDFRINDVKADPEYGWVLTHQFNMLHNCPVMAVPSGFASSGVPTGIQIVGRSFDDARVFRAALAYEKAMGGWFRDRKSRPG